MALDGLTVSCIINELENSILGGRVDKIYQPEKDEIIIQIRNNREHYKLILTTNASTPRINLIETKKENPIKAPLFCMVLRKHLSSGKITKITQPNFERIVNIHIESINEMGDYSEKILVFEIMGKHSNIILTDTENNILDCIKYISHDKSSVREVLPGKKYIFPPNQNKINPINTSKEEFEQIFFKNFETVQECIYKSYTGISPVLASEICVLANVIPSTNIKSLEKDEIIKLYESFENVFFNVKNSSYSPEIVYNESNKVIEFTPIQFSMFKTLKRASFESISKMLEKFYETKDLNYRMSQKTNDLKKVISNNIERCVKKKEMQIKTLKDISNRNQLKIYGELITSNIYAIKKGMNKVFLNNFYSENNEEIEIPLDPNLTPAENAQKYFKKYNKQKRTFIAINEQIKQNNEELNYLESVLSSIGNCISESDIKEIREELYNEKILKKQGKKDNKASNQKSKPFHFLSSDGFHIYVGKNNIQNDNLTLKVAKPNDIWLHTKDIPGSHVIILSESKEISEQAIIQAANLAAFYSKGSNSSNVPIDYTFKKFVKKPSKAKAGMVIYEKNKTLYITPNKELIESLEEIK